MIGRACSPWCPEYLPTMVSTFSMRSSRHGPTAEPSTRSAYDDPSSSRHVSPVPRSRGSRRPNRPRSNQTSPERSTARSRYCQTRTPTCVSMTTLHRGTRCAKSAAPTVAACCTVSRPESRAPAPTCTPPTSVTIAGHAVDRFELTDRNGHKLEEPGKQLVIDAIRGGVTPRRRRLGRRR